MNEPEVEDSYKWQGLQAKFAAAIRQGAPQHTIIVAGGRWSSVDELLQMQPLSDPNIIYNFHFYTPHNFTHQGATWSGNLQHYLTQRVPYPSKPADAAALQQQVPTELDKLWISSLCLRSVECRAYRVGDFHCLRVGKASGAWS